MPNSAKGPTKKDAQANLGATLNRAVTAHQNGQLDQADLLYRSVLDTDGRQFDALHMLGVLEAQRGRFTEGRNLIAQALKANPQSADAHCNLARVLKELGRPDQALASFDKALAINPVLIIALNNRGALLRELGRRDEALADYDRALTLAPNNIDVMFNRGNLLIDLRRPEDALAAFDAVLSYHAGYVDAKIGRANALTELRRQDEALEILNDVIIAHPNYALPYRNRGNLMMQRGLLRNAAADFATALQIDGTCDYVLGSYINCRLSVCDWAGIDEARAALREDIGAGRRASVPAVMLAANGSPKDQLACARMFMAGRNRQSAALPVRPAYPHDRIRLAYVSGDFGDGATAFLTAGLFEQHDRTRFETTAFSLSPAQPGAMHERLTGAFERFVDASSMTDAEIVAEMQALEIDIAVDLTGHMRHARPDVFVHRPAPIQVNYLGYPGTMGANCIDYIIADRFVIPEAAKPFYSEKVVYLPDTFQANDSRRLAAEATPSRAELGLPDRGFVFCAFHGSHRINPEVFTVWTSLLRQVEGSVLWLIESNEFVADSLRREASARGIDEQRLVFAPAVPYADHLARLRLADLCLDTLPFNGDASTSDALWMGLPVITATGETFSARMSGSLLNAVGLPELVTASLADYEALALRLAGEPAMLSALRDRLVHNRATHPLFDTARFTRHIEAAYAGMWRRFERGSAPASFAVEPIG